MKKNIGIVIAGVCILIAVFGFGYQFGEKNAKRLVKNQNNQDAHVIMMDDMTGLHESMSMTDMMHVMNAGLQEKSGDAFDQAFLAEMIVHHEGAVTMAQMALINAKRQEIKELADAIIVAQEKEIAQMKTWQKNWYNQ